MARALLSDAPMPADDFTTRSRFSPLIHGLWLLAVCGCSSAEDSASGIGCYQNHPDGADSDCQALGLPRKLQCDSDEDFAQAESLGCKPEDPNDSSDNDVCCPPSVKSRFASITEFCQKCATCTRQSGFEEGFCTPFVSSGGFDVSACEDASSTYELENRYVSAATLAAWSCPQFDANE
ncbi:MAG: hypothetical protein AB7K71_23780 [Polyangiaceae bacterium]